MNLVTKKKFYLMLLVVVLILLIGVSTKFVKPPKTPNQKTEERSINDTGAIIIDFDGDGVAETLKVEEKDKRVNMVVFDINGKELADLVEDITLYPTTLYKVIKLRGNSQKQYLQWNMAVGPHQVETVFLTIYKDKVFPVYSYDIENKYMYSPFYNSRGELLLTKRSAKKKTFPAKSRISSLLTAIKKPQPPSPQANLPARSCRLQSRSAKGRASLTRMSRCVRILIWTIWRS